MIIKDKQRGHDWHTSIQPGEERWGRGKSLAEAIGDVILSYQNETGISIMDPIQLAHAEAREAALSRAEALHDAYPHATDDRINIAIRAVYEKYGDRMDLFFADAAKEATQPSAAEVIRVAKAALEFAQQASGSRLFHDSRRKALATISAWEAKQ